MAVGRQGGGRLKKRITNAVLAILLIPIPLCKIDAKHHHDTV